MLGLSHAPRVVMATASAPNSVLASSANNNKSTCMQTCSLSRQVAKSHWSTGQPSAMKRCSVKPSCLDSVEGLRAPLYKKPHFDPLSMSRAPPMANKNNVCALLTDALPPAFGFVAIVAGASALLLQWQMIMTVRKRIEIGLKYPKMYEGTEDSVFDCYQRAHMNTLESYPQFLALLLLDGAFYPITASVLGAIWVVGRIVYSLGYYTGNPKNRARGSFNFLGLIGLNVTAFVIGFQKIKPLLMP
eukprot:TRINITY_DN33_c0_g1_i1.p1 TRINITY_DN33_c0_g1~~TRINITY_DN33_c0_g1_i1.p1  ORF type:complete len:245 (+),score=31.38 TRINITY_DN33_c0_g1_i1:148-882(+)